MAVIGFEWNQEDDIVNHLSLISNKSFIFSDGEYLTSVDNTWVSVSQTLPTQSQFEEEGMEDLSIFNRQVQPVLDSPIQMTSEGVLGEGRVFKGTVDLKKYFDLRKLEVK